MTPNCSKCQTSQFEVSEIRPAGSKFTVSLVHCARCGAVVGALDYASAHARLDKIEEALKRMAQQMKVASGL
jgi:hypothetical protein